MSSNRSPFPITLRLHWSLSGRYLSRARYYLTIGSRAKANAYLNLADKFSKPLLEYLKQNDLWK